MTILEALAAVNDEYNEECARTYTDKGFKLLMDERVHLENAEIDQELPEVVAQVAAGMGETPGTRLPAYVYLAARLAFRLGMRVQRKLYHPELTTTSFWNELNIRESTAKGHGDFTKKQKRKLD